MKCVRCEFDDSFTKHGYLRRLAAIVLMANAGPDIVFLMHAWQNGEWVGFAWGGVVLILSLVIGPWLLFLD